MLFLQNIYIWSFMWNQWSQANKKITLILIYSSTAVQCGGEAKHE